MDTNFETLPDEQLAELLREFFPSARSKHGKRYSNSGLINLQSGINRHLQLSLHNRIINIMHNDQFQNANTTFKGYLREHKEMGLDVSEPKKAIAKHDLEKMFDEYFISGLARGVTKVLVQRVLFNLLYYTGKHGKEGLSVLHQDQFTIKTTPENKEYVEINFNPTSKTNGTSTNSRRPPTLNKLSCYPTL